MENTAGYPESVRSAFTSPNPITSMDSSNHYM
jgi:hypothetical protein